MTHRSIARNGALPSCAHRGADIRWLEPRSRAGLPPRRCARAIAARIGSTVGTGILLSLASVGTAFAPSASAFASMDLSEAGRIQLAAIAPVEVAPITVPAPDASRDVDVTGQTEGERSAALQAIDDDFNRYYGDVEGARAPGHDPNEILTFGAMRIPRWLVETVVRASEATGVDPVYMMALADKESSFLVENRARTSSAEGLFQFINGTWLEVMRKYGAKHGLQAEAAAIATVDGELQIADEAVRERVLGLRRDPYISALMAAELMKRDRAKIERRIGRDLNRSEFYLAHFLGADSAGKFLDVLDGKPKQNATRLFPAAARANKALFFAKKGRKKRGLSVAEVYGKIDQMIDARLDRYVRVKAITAPASAVASAEPRD